jgi:hypothetical protein
VRSFIALLVSLILAGVVGFTAQQWSIITNPGAPITADCIGISVTAFGLLFLLVAITRQAGRGN